MVALYIVIAVFAIILIVLFLKARVELNLTIDGLTIEWDGNLTLLGGAVKINLKNVAQKSTKEIIQQEEKKQEGKPNILDNITSVGKDLLNKFKKVIVIEEFSTDMSVGFSDPMYTAMFYGTYWGVVGGFYAFLAENIKLKAWHFDLQPDFDNSKIFIKHHSVYTLIPLQILITVIMIFFGDKSIRKLNIFKGSAL